jgi:ketosteroid isomerase-like protein
MAVIPRSLEEQAQRMFELVDSMDTTAMAALITDDAQGVDEISRGWMRGRASLESYFAEMDGMVQEVRSEVRDVNAIEWGDAGVVTCVLDQVYTLDGREQRITAPTSMTFRREGDEWKIALLHSVPLPEQPAAPPPT